jgi:cytochrome c2
VKEVKPMFRNLGVPVILLTLALFSQVSTVTADPAAGKKLFKSKCASCHAVKTDLTGPALMGVMERVPSKEWLYKWVENSTALRESGDDYANQIYDEWKGEQMTSFPELTPEDVDNILLYIDEASVEVVAGPGPGGPETTEDDGSTSAFLWVILAVLFVFAIILSRVVTSLGGLVGEKMGEEPEAERTLLQSIFRPRHIALVVVLLFIGGCYNLIDNAWNLSTSKGYMPEQPIAFSHKIHAGVNKIDCQYCHSNAEKSQHATIPSVNVCMNCHKAIKEYSGGTLWTGTEGTDEIAKVLAAFEEKKPVEWIKVHDLPDHVYFNHSQHVKVGGVACQTCHGPVEEMDEVYVHSEMSMGWCVNCHRETEVGQFKDNEYYAQFTELHEGLVDGSVDMVTVEKLGGTECQKCHY